MKNSAKYICLFLGLCALLCGAFYLIASRGDCPQTKCVRYARKALNYSVEDPGTLEILHISKPDSVFGRNFVTEDERNALTVLMMRAGTSMLESFEEDGFNLGDSASSNSMADLMTRQMEATSVIRALMSAPDNDATEHTGWKVKIEYRAAASSGKPYHCEGWYFFDKDADCVLMSFNVPLP